MEFPPGVRWNWLAPAFRDALCPRVATECALLALGDRLHLVPELDGARLLAEGAAGAWRWQDGRLLAVVQADALLGTARRAELERCLDALADAPGPAPLRLLCGGADHTLAFLLWAALGPAPAAAARLRGAPRSPAELCRAAKAWHHLLSDPAEAAAALGAAEAGSDTVEDWLACAEARGALGDEEGLRRCVAAAEAVGASLGDRGAADRAALACARARLTLCGDLDAARARLAELEELAEVAAGEGTSALLLACADTWALLGDLAGAGRCLEAAERHARGAADLAACAALRVDVLGEEEGGAVRRCLEAAEARARTAEAWAQIAACWLSRLEEHEEGQRCLRAAERTATSGADWLTLARAWRDLFAHDEEERRCRLQELELRAGDDYAVRARGWREIFHDDAEARRRLQEAEGRLLRPREWEAAARAWLEVFADEEAARRCAEEAARLRQLEEAIEQGDWLACARGLAAALPAAEASRRFRTLEAGARRLSDWLTFAAAWVEVFAAGDEARRCLAGAERLAGGPEELVRLGAAWRRVLPGSDDAEARRCMAAAEAAAQSGAEWLALAAAWEEHFADAEAARRARLRELALRAGGDVVVLAQGWRALLPSAEEARQRLHQAEAGAEGIAAWEALARAWREAFGDEEEGARCAARAARLRELEEALGRRDWLGCARLWRELLPVPEARQRFAELEARAQGLTEAAAVAEGWATLLDDAEAARRVLSQAAGQATMLPERLRLAAAWKSVGEEAEARGCLAAAEAQAETAEDWLRVAATWQAPLGDRAEEVRCRLRELALRVGDDPERLVERARGWRAIFSAGPEGEAEARRRVQEVEAQALDMADWLRLGRVWEEVFQDAAEAERCRAEADRLRQLEEAMAAGQWRSCAVLWKHMLPDVAEARRRFQALEARARTLQDWIAFAESWRAVFDDEAESRRCMKAAEERVRFRSDWKACADAWRRMGDFVEAERCSR